MSSERNWAENLTYGAARIARPESVGALRKMLARGGSVRALGTRHCFNDIADTDGTLVSLERLPHDVEIDGDVARISGGARYGDIALDLHTSGRALANLASLPHISVAGAVATGTHGSGDRTPSLAAAVRALTFATASGDLVTLRRGDADFAGAVVHLGSLGIVTELELETEPAYDVAQTVFDAPRWDRILEDVDGVTSLGDSVSIFTTWREPDHADQLWVKTRAGREIDLARVAALGARAADGPRHPIPGVAPDACGAQGGISGPWYEQLPHFRLDFTPSVGAELQSEYLLPRADAAAAIEAVRGIADRISPHLHICEIRTIAADDLWLSPSNGRDSVGLHFTWHHDEPAVREILPILEAALDPFDARPHWGKLFTMDPARIRALYPQWDDFRDLRKRIDPSGRFQNAYTRRLGL